MKKQTTEQMKEKVKQIEACLRGDQILNEIDNLLKDRTQQVQEKIFRITRMMNEFTMAKSRTIDDIVQIRYQGKEYTFPLWKMENLITYCEVRLNELRNPPARKYKNRAYGVALIIARKRKKIHSRNWYQKDLKEIASKVFNDIGDPHHAVRIAIDFENKLTSLKLDHPDDYQDGEELFKTNRSRFETLFPTV